MKLLEWWLEPSIELYEDKTGWQDIEGTNLEFIRAMNYESVAAGFANKLQKFIDSFGAGVDF